MFQVAMLYSGSRGNACLVRTARTKLVVDVGFSGKRFLQCLQELELSAEKVQAIVVSHEHNDHIAAVGIVARKLKIPVYLTAKTYESCRHKLGKLPEGVRRFVSGERFEIGDLEIDPFASSHDAIDPCNFIFAKSSDKQKRKLGLATDTGYISKLLLNKLQACTTLILESNHDKNILLTSGNYPWELVQRIKSRVGHLSNEEAAGVLSKVAHSGLKSVVLAHISAENNLPDLALQQARQVLKIFGASTDVVLASQDKSTELLDV